MCKITTAFITFNHIDGFNEALLFAENYNGGIFESTHSDHEILG